MTFIETQKQFPKLDWNTFPTNERGIIVGDRIALDCKDSSFLNIVSGYSGLDQIISFITRKASDSKIKLVFGHEPSISSISRIHSPRKIDTEMRDYWLEKGFSPSSNSAVMEAIQAIKDRRVIARIHTERFLHAKAYITENAAVFGSSNFSKPGLETSRELNGRHLNGSIGYFSVNEFFNGCWDRSEDFTERLLSLLERLLRYSTWQEALARSCAALLEGDWAKQLIPPNMKEDFDNLWPHQRQGIAQALTVLETQGAVVIADPTGSGKTKTGGWLIRLAYQKILSNGGEMATNLIPVMVCPASVEKNWRPLFDDLGVRPEVISTGIVSGGRKESSKNRLKLINKTNLLSVDEIHNFYGTSSNRTKNLSENLAESRIFMTATPINKEFQDLIKLMNLLGTEELDGETFSRLKILKDDIMSLDKNKRNEARKEANKLIQKFMVRRTRNDLRYIVENRSDEYLLESGRVANYPEYEAVDYSLNSEKDDEIISEISSHTSKLLGIARISHLRVTKQQKKLGVTEKQTLDRILKSQPALSEYNVWKMLDSSVPALYEHLMGTDELERKLDWLSGKEKPTYAQGVINKLRKMPIPEWGFSEEFKNDKSVPPWLLDNDEFEKARVNEINLYESILSLTEKLSDSRIDSKINCIIESIKNNGKTLVFDTSNITLLFLEKKLKDLGIETHTFIGSTKGSKNKKVNEAEELFGLNSDDKSRVALLSDMMSEGINLQGSSNLIHLTTPSTIRLAEQRVGRVDRMNTRFDEIKIYYPKKDLLSSQMKPYLKERNKLVGDIIGSNIILPDDDGIDNLSEDGDEMLSSIEMNEKMFSERNGLFDAFHEVRELIGENGLISNIEYDDMRTSNAKVMSYVGYVKSQKPWCFFVIESNKNGAPQWVFLDDEKRNAKKNFGLVIDTPEICSELRTLIPESSNIEPSENADKIVKGYLEHISKNQFKLLPQRRQSLLSDMAYVLLKWKNMVGHQSEIGKRLEELRFEVIGKSGNQKDKKKIASKWMEYLRDNSESLEYKTTRKKKKGHLRTKLVENPPNDFESFLQTFESIDIIPDLESRVIAMIAGIPEH
jgi:superfamily II DNA or RNA helicase